MTSYFNQVLALPFFLPFGLPLAQVTGNNIREQSYLVSSWICENFTHLPSLFHGLQLGQYLQIILLAPYNWADWCVCFWYTNPFFFLWRTFSVWNEVMTWLVWKKSFQLSLSSAAHWAWEGLMGEVDHPVIEILLELGKWQPPSFSELYHFSG